jgi:adenosylcobinamide kinase / adenosylcobinamide-phosphate guanylyltransferase
MLVFISGGVRSGKSTLGEKLAVELATGNKIYLATSRAYDDEMRRRILKHQKDRAQKGFITIEKSENIGEIVPQLGNGDTVLMDCLGNLVANEMFGEDPTVYNTQMKKEITEKIYAEIIQLNSAAANLIVISNEVFSSGISYNRATEDYLAVLGQLHIQFAAAAQQAIECTFGTYTFHKGGVHSKKT